MLLNLPQCTGELPTTKNFTAKNIKNAQIEKPWSGKFALLLAPQVSPKSSWNTLIYPVSVQMTYIQCHPSLTLLLGQVHLLYMLTAFKNFVALLLYNLELAAYSVKVCFPCQVLISIMLGTVFNTISLSSNQTLKIYVNCTNEQMNEKAIIQREKECQVQNTIQEFIALPLIRHIPEQVP